MDGLGDVIRAIGEYGPTPLILAVAAGLVVWSVVRGKFHDVPAVTPPHCPESDADRRAADALEEIARALARIAVLMEIESAMMRPGLSPGRN